MKPELDYDETKTFNATNDFLEVAQAQNLNPHELIMAAAALIAGTIHTAYPPETQDVLTRRVVPTLLEYNLVKLRTEEVAKKQASHVQNT